MNSDFARRLITSAATKPFLILTGRTGTGKTRLAKYFGEWLGGKDRCLVQPVGADWTDSRNVIGYFNPLLERYETTPILNHVLEANEDPDRPYFLVLDEMNLSHVEYYFADFLSAMESERKIPLHQEPGSMPASGSGHDDSSGSDLLIQKSVEVPSNLFILGTVNVDETTKMFSPKVLDRANVLEFTVTGEEFKKFLEDPNGKLGEVETSPRKGEEFLNLSYAARGLDSEGKLPPLPEDAVDEFREALKTVFGIMAERDRQFGYRTGAEALRYLRVYFQLSEEQDWTEAFDEVMVQKVLPKLHGGKDEIFNLLVALGIFFIDEDEDKAMGVIGGGGDIQSISDKIQEGNDPVFERSSAKVGKLLHQLERRRYASFL